MKKLLFVMFTAFLLAGCNQPTQGEDETLEETPVVVEEKKEEKTEVVQENPKTEEKTEVKEEPKPVVETKNEVPTTETVVQETTSETVEQTEQTTDEETTEQESEETPAEQESEETPAEQESEETVEDTYSEVHIVNDNDEIGYKVTFIVPEGYDPKNYLIGDNSDPSVNYELLKFEYVKTVNKKEHSYGLNAGNKKEPYLTADVYNVFINDKYEGDYLFIYYTDIYTKNADFNIAYTIDKVEGVYNLYSAVYKFKDGTFRAHTGNAVNTATTIGCYEK